MGRSAERSPADISSAAAEAARGRCSNPGCQPGAVVSSITAGQIDAAVPKRPLIVATSQGDLPERRRGATWTAGTGVPAALTLTVAQFGPLDPNLAYAGADAGGSTGGDFYRSTDGGLTYHKADTGLPNGSKNIDAIAIANTTPPEVVVAVNPPTGGSHVYLESDTTALAPPKLVPESPGALVPSSVPTPMPTATPVAQAVKPTAATAGKRYSAVRASRVPLADAARVRGVLRAARAVRLHPLAAALLRGRTSLAVADLR